MYTRYDQCLPQHLTGNVRKHFKLCKCFFQLQEPVRTKLSVCKILNLKIIFC